MTRRDLSLMLPTLGALGSTMGYSQTDQSEQLSLLHSACYSFDQLPVRRSSGGATTRPVLHGRLPTGEVVEVHETTLLPGQMPHPAHKHLHTEFMFVREGSVQFAANGVSQELGPGGIAYAASEEMHGLKNVSSAPVNYFVIAIGRERRES
ncbi:MAG: cupin domain-containing protein [Bryobacteraceae bacterium]